MSELLPCPFCGGEADEYEGDYGNGIYCMDCGAMVGEPIHMEYRVTERVAIEQAIEAWNTRADGYGECEFVIEDNMNETEGMGDVWFRCTNCNTKYDYYADDWLLKQNHCPHCGFKVVGK